MALTALAGPAANLLLAYLGMVAWKILYYWAPTTMITIFAARFLQYLVMMDVGLAVFNLIPIPPLDGSRILLVALPQRIYFQIMRYERVIFVILLAAVWAGVLDGVLGHLQRCGLGSAGSRHRLHRPDRLFCVLCNHRDGDLSGRRTDLPSGGL